jgi:sugar/nucleoside kinase (ribokinase family)
VTRGRRGLRVYSGADIYDLPAFPATEVDPTGAGDVYAAAFLIALREKKPVVAASRWAACAAALSVEGPGVQGIPTRRALEARLKAYG